MKRAVLICFVICTLSFVNVFAFSDTDNHWAENYIVSMSEKGYVSGYPDGRFLPEKPITRAEFASIAVRLFGYPQDADSGELYLDVKKTDWYAPYVVSAGLTFPEIEDYFRPDDMISRYEAAASMLNIYGYFEADGTDKAKKMADYSEFSDDELVVSVVEGALEFGIMQGSDEGFKPYDSLNRAELCTIMARASDIFGMPEKQYYDQCIAFINEVISIYYNPLGENDEQVIQPVPEVQPEDETSLEKQVLELVNKERRANGLSELVWDDKLAEVARLHSEDMAANGFFDHTNQKGETPFDRMQKHGIKYRAAAENIAAGQRTAEAVVESWLNSPGHRANILGRDFTKMGVGIANGGSYGIYWTQCFTG